MTLRGQVGWETGDSSEAFSTSGTFSIQNSLVRSGSWALQANPLTTGAAEIVFGLTQADGSQTTSHAGWDEIYIVLWLNYTTRPAANDEPFIRVDGNVGDGRFELRLDSDGHLNGYKQNTVLVEAGTTVLAGGVFNKIEMKVTYSGTTATYEVILNNAVELSGTFAVTAGSDTEAILVGKPSNRNGQTVDWVIDDLIYDDAEYPGTTAGVNNIAIVALTADGVGSNDQWGLGAGASKQAAVSVIPPDGDTSYIEETTATQVQDLTLVAASTIPILEPILAVKATGIGRQDGAAGQDYGVGIKQGATYDRTTAAFQPSTSYEMCALLAEVDPVSSLAFTTGDLDSLQTSVERGASSGGNRIRVTQVLLHVAYSAVPPIPPTLPADEPDFTLLDNAERIAQEDAFVVIDQTARDQIRAVFISAIDPVANVVLSIVGGDCDHDPTQLPGLKLTWDEVVPPSGVSFIAYDIMRRVAGQDDWTRIAVLTDMTTLTYTDFCTTSRVTYEYSVRWRVTAGAAQVTSPDTDPPPFAQVEFDFLFIHLEADASVFVRLDTYRADKRRLRDQRQLAVWGRERPTVAIGQQIWHQLRIPGLQQLLSERVGVWERLLDLMDQEREQTSVVCVRFGRASERYFCNFVQETQRQAQKNYTPDVTLVEVHFDEAV